MSEEERDSRLKGAWAPLAVAALSVPVVVGFLVAGPALGLALGAVAGATLIVVAARQVPQTAIETAPSTDARRHTLLVITREVDDPALLDELARRAGVGIDERSVIRVLSPTDASTLERWAGDFRGGQEEAQRRLTLTVASLAGAGVAAEARVGDVDLVQAVEDQLRSFPATDVVMVSGDDADEPAAAAAAAVLEARLEQPFTRVVAP